jgi:aldehyde dehydrogenase (NAD+)
MSELERAELFIGGEWRAPLANDPMTAVVNAADATVLAYVAAGSARDVDAAVVAARSATESWSRTSPEERAQLLEAVRDEIASRQEEIARRISLEVGTPRLISERVQVGLPILTLQGFADAAREHEWQNTVGNSTVYREAAGVVAAITPWNYPLHQLVGKVGAAVAAGCSVIAKPADIAPLSAFALAEAFAAAGAPDGLFNLISGPGRTVGEAMAAHPDVDVVSFTGSTHVGARIAALAAPNITRVALELGGKSASVILDDADIPRAVKASVNNAFLNSGQTCSAWTRLVVPRAHYDDVVGLACDAAQRLTLGHPLAEGTRLGPLASAAARESVRTHIRRAEDDGARLVMGGADEPDGLPDGFYVRPTIFVDVDPDAAIAQEEVFGPVLVILAHDGDDDALAIANNSRYGLAGGVWSGDAERATSIARRIRTGQVDINGARFNPNAPFGGYKNSGLGREFGRYGLEEFLELKSVQR